LRHHIDAKEWREFDKQYLHFASDPQNTRLGLANNDAKSLSAHEWHALYLASFVDSIEFASLAMHETIFNYTINDYFQKKDSKYEH